VEESKWESVMVHDYREEERGREMKHVVVHERERKKIE